MGVPSRDEIASWSVDERAEVARHLDGLQDHRDLEVGFVRRRRITLMAVALAGVCLFPWIGYLAVSLPDASRAEAWKFAWVGFDTGLALVLLATAWLGFHRRLLTAVGLTVAATLLVVDAWFDLTLSFHTAEQAGSVIDAFIEIPFAILLIVSGWAILHRSVVVFDRLRGEPEANVSLWRQRMFGVKDHPLGR
jgi:hypothetical protein